MAPNFIFPQRDQPFLMPPALQDWLPESDYVWFVIDCVDKMDISPFMAHFRLDGKGGALFEPRMMLTLLVYSYSMGIRSSRKIEQLCERDIAFRIICGNLKPDHTSIARFRQRHEKAFEDFFLRVLELCREAKLTKAGVIAVDGTKLEGNTSLAANRTEETLREEVQQIIAEAEEQDAKDDQIFGANRGDELPTDLQKSKDRQTRIKECLEQIEARKAADAAKQDELRRKREEQEQSGKKPRGRKPSEKTEEKSPKANVTDPDSRIMNNGKGFLQGYNAQAVANEHQIIVAADVVQDQNDQKQFHPMMDQAVDNLISVGETDLPHAALADAGYPSKEVLAIPTAGGMEPFIAIRPSSAEKLLKEQPPRGRIPQGASNQYRMARKLKTKRGKQIYKLRAEIIEPVFGQIKTGTVRFDCFSRRGKKACRSEWKFVPAIHNLRKLWKHNRNQVEKGPTIH